MRASERLRLSLDLQVHSVWAGMDKILESVRDEPGVVCGSVYARLKSAQLLLPEGASELDWDYKHVSTEQILVFNVCLESDPMNIIDESKEQCGFEAYRLFGRAYDSLDADTEHVLLSHILALSSWSVEGLPQI